MNTAYLKKLHKNASAKFAEDSNPAEAEKVWKTKAAGAMKKILANWDNYDVLMGQSMDGDAMYVSRFLPFLWNLKLTCF